MTLVLAGGSGGGGGNDYYGPSVNGKPQNLKSRKEILDEIIAKSKVGVDGGNASEAIRLLHLFAHATCQLCYGDCLPCRCADLAVH